MVPPVNPPPYIGKMNKDTQLIWEAFLGESYFDSWKLPEGHEDWRVKNKNENGVIGELTIMDQFNLLLKGSKPMAMLDGTDEKEAKMISQLQEKGFAVKKADNHPDPKRPQGAVFVGINPEWVEKGIQAWYDNDDIEFGKALGFGEHSMDLRTPEYQAKVRPKGRVVDVDLYTRPKTADDTPEL